MPVLDPPKTDPTLWRPTIRCGEQRCATEFSVTIDRVRRREHRPGTTSHFVLCPSCYEPVDVELPGELHQRVGSSLLVSYDTLVVRR